MKKNIPRKIDREAVAKSLRELEMLFKPRPEKQCPLLEQGAGDAEKLKEVQRAEQL